MQYRTVAKVKAGANVMGYKVHIGAMSGGGWVATDADFDVDADDVFRVDAQHDATRFPTRRAARRAAAMLGVQYGVIDPVRIDPSKPTTRRAVSI